METETKEPASYDHEDKKEESFVREPIEPYGRKKLSITEYLEWEADAAFGGWRLPGLRYRPASSYSKEYAVHVSGYFRRLR